MNFWFYTISIEKKNFKSDTKYNHTLSTRVPEKVLGEKGGKLQPTFFGLKILKISYWTSTKILSPKIFLKRVAKWDFKPHLREEKNNGWKMPVCFHNFFDLTTINKISCLKIYLQSASIIFDNLPLDRNEFVMKEFI